MWVCSSKNQLADCLTKKGPSGEMLYGTMSGKIQIQLFNLYISISFANSFTLI